MWFSIPYIELGDRDLRLFGSAPNGEMMRQHSTKALQMFLRRTYPLKKQDYIMGKQNLRELVQGIDSIKINNFSYIYISLHVKFGFSQKPEQ